MKTIIIIPTYNERHNVEDLVEKIYSQNIPDLQIILVDDGSPDGTADLIANLQKRYPITLIQRNKKMGLGSAYVRGFKEALRMQADYIFEMDADLSHDPNDIKKIISKVEEGFDLVIGSRKVKGGQIIGWNIWRHLMSNGAMFLSRLLLGIKSRDVTAGYRCFRSRVIESINFDLIKSNGYAFQEELLFLTEKHGFKVAEVPVIFHDRTLGHSKLSKKDIIEFFLVIIKIRLFLK